METKTFKEIWEEASQQQRTTLRVKIITKTLVGDLTLKNWAKGKNQPAGFPAKKAVAEAVNEAMSINTTPEILFPEKYS